MNEYDRTLNWLRVFGLVLIGLGTVIINTAANVETLIPPEHKGEDEPAPDRKDLH